MFEHRQFVRLRSWRDLEVCSLTIDFSAIEEKIKTLSLSERENLEEKIKSLKKSDSNCVVALSLTMEGSSSLHLTGFEVVTVHFIKI